MSLSFALSGLTYFWDFVDTKIVYRKHLGVVGLAYGFVHGGISLGFYLYDYFVRDVLLLGSDFNVGTVWIYFGLPVSNWVAFISAIIAIVYFMLMASISNRYGPLVLGGQLWRKVLRFGYFAMFLIFIHESIKNYTSWGSWYTNIFVGGTLIPPLSLISGVILIAIFILRGSLELSVRTSHKKNGKKENGKHPET
jgi:DMSO/TMAO reductase YedYZ heme-binding membrane subunit